MRLELHVPGLREMNVRAKWLADPATMAYNRGQAIDAEGYDPETGCIDFPMGDWRYWRGIWLYQEPDRFSAYLLDRETGAFVGEACYYGGFDPDAVRAGILIAAEHRGRGYAAEGLKLLVGRAFEREEIACLAAELGEENERAIRAYLSAGFTLVHIEDGMVRLERHK